MNGIVRLTIFLGMVLSLTSGCGKPNKPMPVTKENLTDYMQKMKSAASGITPNEFAEARSNPAKQKEVLYKSFIEPMEKMGYSYDKTLYSMVDKIVKKEMPNVDMQTVSVISEMIQSGNGSKEIFFKHGFISRETKDLLDRISQIPVRQ